MVDSEYNMDIYKSVKISIGAVIKNPKLPFVIRYVSDQYKTQQMCDKAILENGETLESAVDCYKKHYPHYPHTLRFVPDC